MNIQTDHYSFELPDESSAEIVSSIPDDAARQRVQDAIDATGNGDPVRLPLGLADTLLNALSEWERDEELKGQPIETTGKIKGTPELPEGGA